MGNVVIKKSGVSTSLQPIELVRHNQHLVLDGTTSSAWKESQMKSIAARRFEDRSCQVRDGAYPLHIAIANGASLRVLQMLIKKAPEVASKTDKFGRTCLHLAIMNGGHSNDVAESESNQEAKNVVMLEVVKLIHSFDNSQVKTIDKKGYLPLHIACEVGCSIEIAKNLINAYPSSIQMMNKDGKYPLDVAVASGYCSKDLMLELSDLAAPDMAQ